MGRLSLPREPRRSKVELRAESGKPPGPLLPGNRRGAAGSVRRFVIDGELVIPVGKVLSFDALQMRLHPAASRIAKLSAETPAMLIVFDMLRTPDGDLASGH